MKAVHLGVQAVKVVDVVDMFSCPSAIISDKFIYCDYKMYRIFARPNFHQHWSIDIYDKEKILLLSLTNTQKQYKFFHCLVCDKNICINGVLNYSLNKTIFFIKFIDVSFVYFKIC